MGDELYMPDDPASLLSDDIDIDVGPHHVCAVTNESEVFCWGINLFGELGLPEKYEDQVGVRTPQRIAGITDPTAVEAGAGYTCGLTELGDVYYLGAISSCHGGVQPEKRYLLESAEHPREYPNRQWLQSYLHVENAGRGVLLEQLRV